MKLNQKLSYKFLLPVGVILWAVGFGGVIGLVGFIVTSMGIVDLVRFIFSKIKKRKEKSECLEKRDE